MRRKLFVFPIFVVLRFLLLFFALHLRSLSHVKSPEKIGQNPDSNNSSNKLWLKVRIQFRDNKERK